MEIPWPFTPSSARLVKFTRSIAAKRDKNGCSISCRLAIPVGQKKSFGICSTQLEIFSSTKAIHWISPSGFDDTMNDFAILSACTDCATLCSPNQPVEVQAFSIWFVAVESPDEQAMTEADPADVNACRAIQAQIDGLYPGLRTASRAEKKRFGQRLLDDALAGRLVESSVPSASDVQISSGRLYRSSGQAGVNQSASFLFFGIQTFDIGCEALVAIEREKSQR
jgi:hypothetical protein